MKKLFQISLLLALTTTAFGQVQFQVEWLESTERYMVSMVSDQTWAPPQNITSTAQISIKVPSSGFEIGDILSEQTDVVFELNGIHESPEEAPEFDYISFGLLSMGTNELSYVAGEKVELFSFKNTGDCSGAIYLLGNEDPFLPPNSSNANIGNQITILGAQGDAYAGNIGEGKADCSFVSSTEEDQLMESFRLFPNPVKDQLNLSFDWSKNSHEATVVLYDLSGKQVMSQALTVVGGKNNLQINAEELQSGTYSLELQVDGKKLAFDQFLKL